MRLSGAERQRTCEFLGLKPWNGLGLSGDGVLATGPVVLWDPVAKVRRKEQRRIAAGVYESCVHAARIPKKMKYPNSYLLTYLGLRRAARAEQHVKIVRVGTHICDVGDFEVNKSTLEEFTPQLHKGVP